MGGLLSAAAARILFSSRILASPFRHGPWHERWRTRRPALPGARSGRRGVGSLDAYEPLPVRTSTEWCRHLTAQRLGCRRHGARDAGPGVRRIGLMADRRAAARPGCSAWPRTCGSIERGERGSSPPRSARRRPEPATNAEPRGHPRGRGTLISSSAPGARRRGAQGRLRSVARGDRRLALHDDRSDQGRSAPRAGPSWSTPGPDETAPGGSRCPRRVLRRLQRAGSQSSHRAAPRYDDDGVSRLEDRPRRPDHPGGFVAGNALRLPRGRLRADGSSAL